VLDSSREDEVEMRILIPITLTLLAAFALWSPVGAQDNPHGELGVDCQDCHSDEGWLPIRKPLPFKHGDVGFPLAGSHKKVKCMSCHETLEFARVATACADCHRDVHRGEFGYRCETCHVAKSWDNRRQMWDRHAETLFPLTGVHATLDCQVCHRATAPFQFALAPIDCISCHEADYLGADPDHQAAGFPTDCQICHGTSSWDPLGFPDHEALFPINSGPHAGVWGACTDCHTTPGDFSIFDCTPCHSQSEMDNEHEGEPGYVYESTACYSCHPTGRADDD
jgi:hypothetical protein